MKQNITVGDIGADWPGTVADYIRHNDEAVFMATDKLLNTYQNYFLNCGSFESSVMLLVTCFFFTDHFHSTM